VSNKVRAAGADGVPRWLALEGGPCSGPPSPRPNSTTPASMAAWPKRSASGSPSAANLAAASDPSARSSASLRIAHGREPTTVEAIALTQQATLETRQAKHEPRSLAEQRQRWRTQAIELLGSREALPGLLAHVLSGRRRPAQPITQEWIDEQARRVITTVAETRVVWRATHVYAEAQRRVRATGHAGYDTLAQQIAAVALSAPYSLAVGVDRDADLGEPDPLRRRDGESVFATHHTRQFTNGEVFAAERRILAAAGRFDGRRAELADVELALETQAGLGHTLNAGQEALVRHMATCRARVALTLAPAGTGKTTAMATLARAWQNGGGTIVGLAPSAAAAEALRQDIGVDATDTIAKYRWLQRTPPEDRDPAPAREWFDTIGPDTRSSSTKPAKPERCTSTPSSDARWLVAPASGSSVTTSNWPRFPPAECCATSGTATAPRHCWKWFASKTTPSPGRPPRARG
jgi:AAA domain